MIKLENPRNFPKNIQKISGILIVKNYLNLKAFVISSVMTTHTTHASLLYEYYFCFHCILNPFFKIQGLN